MVGWMEHADGTNTGTAAYVHCGVRLVCIRMQPLHKCSLLSTRDRHIRSLCDDMYYVVWCDGEILTYTCIVFCRK